MPFRLRSTYLFLTYPRVLDVTIDDFTAELLSVIRKLHWSCFRVAHELHADGTPHFHVALALSSRCDIKNENRLNVLGHHGKYEGCRSFGACVNYLDKPDYIAQLDFPDEETVSEAIRTADTSSALAPSAAVYNFQDELKWIDYCIAEQISPAYGFKIWQATNRDHGDTLEEDYEEGGTITHPTLLALQFDPTRKTYCIWGNSTGVGKSTWVRINAPKPALRISHIDGLDKYDPEYHKSVIFEEMTFTHVPKTAQIKICDETETFQHHCRYKHRALRGGTYKFITSNDPPFDFHEPPIARRVVSIEINAEIPVLDPLGLGLYRQDRVG